MLSLLTYCYAAGSFGSKEIAELTRYDQAVQSLCGGKWVDASEIRIFRRQQRNLLHNCLTELLHEARRSNIPVFDLAADEHSAAWEDQRAAIAADAEERIRLSILIDSIEMDD